METDTLSLEQIHIIEGGINKNQTIDMAWILHGGKAVEFQCDGNEQRVLKKETKEHMDKWIGYIEQEYWRLYMSIDSPPVRFKVDYFSPLSPRRLRIYPPFETNEKAMCLLSKEY